MGDRGPGAVVQLFFSFLEEDPPQSLYPSMKNPGAVLLTAAVTLPASLLHPLWTEMHPHVL